MCAELCMLNRAKTGLGQVRERVSEVVLECPAGCVGHTVIFFQEHPYYVLILFLNFSFQRQENFHTLLYFSDTEIV